MHAIPTPSRLERLPLEELLYQNLQQLYKPLKVLVGKTALKALTIVIQGHMDHIQALTDENTRRPLDLIL
jgi:hypothetical protein